MNMFWNLQNQQLVAGLNSNVQVTGYSFYLRDVLPISLALVTEQASETQPYAVTALEATQSIKFGAKAAASDTEFLFSEATWTDNGSALPDTRYTADVSLNTAALIAALGSLSSLVVIGEFTIQNADNSNELTTQFNITIKPDIIKGTEGVPTTEYNVVAQYMDDNGVAAVRLVNSNGVAVGLFKNGTPYVFILSTGLWYPLTGTIIGGVPVPAFGAGENI